MLKKIIKTTARGLGYDIRRSRTSGGEVGMPVELTDREREIVRDVMASRLTMVSHERLWTTIMACKHVVEQDIPGDFVECGVWRGGNAIAAAEIFRLYDSPRKVWLFDTFAGMTAPTDADVRVADGRSVSAEFEKAQRDGHNEWCYASLNDVRSSFATRNLDLGKVVFVAGDVCQTLDEAPPRTPDRISVLRLDTDWYESTKKELEILYPRLSAGGCLIIDDYGHWSGSKKATDEYFDRVGHRPFLQYTDRAGRVGVKTR